MSALNPAWTSFHVPSESAFFTLTKPCRLLPLDDYVLLSPVPEEEPDALLVDLAHAEVRGDLDVAVLHHLVGALEQLRDSGELGEEARASARPLGGAAFRSSPLGGPELLGAVLQRLCQAVRLQPRGLQRFGARHLCLPCCCTRLLPRGACHLCLPCCCTRLLPRGACHLCLPCCCTRLLPRG